MVEDQVTGFVARPLSNHMEFYWESNVKTGTIPVKSEFERAVASLNPEVVSQIKEFALVLIDKPSLRRQMGRIGRAKVDHGEFSIDKRNEVLKSVFDKALNS